MWDIRSFSRLQSLTLTFTRYYSRYRGTRLVSIWLDQGFKSYVMYCTVLYCTVLYCTVPYCTLLYCTVLYRTVIYCTVLYFNVRCQYILLAKKKFNILVIWTSAELAEIILFDKVCEKIRYRVLEQQN